MRLNGRPMFAPRTTCREDRVISRCLHWSSEVPTNFVLVIARVKRKPGDAYAGLDLIYVS